MLSMDYFDRDGNKWSIEKGDWKSHQAQNHPVKKSLSEFKAGGFVLLFLALAVLIAFVAIK